ncbi:MAG: helix-turn-helix domain-containing protein [Candidatus Cryptobacteroides sp.]
MEERVEPERIVGRNLMTKYGYIENMIFSCSLKGDMDMTYDIPLKPHSHIMAIINNGHLDIIVNGKEFTFGKGCFINIPVWAEISGLRYRGRFRAMFTAAEETFVKDIFQNRNPLPPDFRSLIGFSITSEVLEAAEMKKICKDMDDIIDALSDKDHNFAEEVSYAYFYIMLTDVADMICKRYETSIPVHTMDMRRADGILKAFVDLLGEHIEKETEIGFYAEKLCISKQYLASIVKEKTHVTASTIIASMRMQVATKLLRDPQMTIEQVAARMSFSDRSAFGKFFRKHSGTTPMKYRRNLRKSLLTLRPENMMVGKAKEGI